MTNWRESEAKNKGWDCFGLRNCCTYIPAALLAEAHLAAGDDDDGRLGVRLADLVAAVVVAALAEVGLAAVHRARRALRAPAAPPGPERRRFIGLTDGAAAAAGSFVPSAAPNSPSTPSLRSTEHSARLSAPRGAAAGEGAAAVVAMPDAAAGEATAPAAVAAMGGGGAARRRRARPGAVCACLSRSGQ